MFKHVFTPFTIGNMEVRNRIVMLPITTGYSEVDETVGDRFINFYSRRAKGGAGCIIIPFAPFPGGSSIEPGVYDDRFISGLQKLTTEIHSYGAKTAAQLMASYHVVFGNGHPEVVGPSPIMNRMMHIIPRELTVGEIEYLIEEYGQSARRARLGGFDAVEIPIIGGYLLNRFLSPISNKRIDRYGGSLEKRMRIILEIIKVIKTKAGTDFPISVRLNAEEQMEGGHTIEDSKIVAQSLENAGVDLINVYTGWHESPVPTVAPSVAPGAFAYIAEQMKTFVSIPVCAANRINSPSIAEKILAGKMADLIGMGRALIADPDLPNKAREGRIDEINPCIACNNCLWEIVSKYRSWGERGAVSCTVNPFSGFEGDYILRAAEKKKKVVVIGGGPAGMESAIIAASRGHEVVLYEKSMEMGGWLIVGCLPPHKNEIKALYEYMKLRTKTAGVQIRLGSEANPETIAGEKPDVLVLALGAKSVIPSIPGVKGSNVIMAEDLLADRKKVSGSILIIGGGLVGCETAEYLLSKDKGVTGVIVIEMLKRIADSISPTYRPFFLERLKKLGVSMMTSTVVEEITGNGVKVIHKDTHTSEFINGDAVVLAVGLRPEKTTLDSFKDRALEVYLIGDCVKPRTIKEAIEEGFRIGMNI